MADLPIRPLSRAREQKITELSNHFASDDLTLEDLERRIERVYKAANIAELDAITADLPGPAQLPVATERPEGGHGPFGRTSASPASYGRETGRLLAIMSSTRRVGRWAMPRTLDVVAIMSDTRIDLTSAVLPPGVIDLDLHVVMAAFKLIVPPNVRVVNEMHSFMADVSSRAHELPPENVPAAANAPVIRLSGYAVMAEVKIIVRRVEDGVYDDDIDDDD